MKYRGLIYFFYHYEHTLLSAQSNFKKTNNTNKKSYCRLHFLQFVYFELNNHWGYFKKHKGMLKYNSAGRLIKSHSRDSPLLFFF